MFLTKVFLRSDCNHSYWKERFLAGLPKLFAEKIRQKIRNQYNGEIPYSNSTYGDLRNFINSEGLNLCTDLKLK